MINIRWKRKRKWIKIQKHTYDKKMQAQKKNHNSMTDYKMKTRQWWKWILIGGNLQQYIFFYYKQNNRWVTSQFLLFSLRIIQTLHIYWKFLENPWKEIVKKNCFNLGFLIFRYNQENVQPLLNGQFDIF